MQPFHCAELLGVNLNDYAIDRCLIPSLFEEFFLVPLTLFMDINIFVTLLTSDVVF